ncbi:hypothetical protein HanXRQr2_Chr01g0033041 [Helianthus annuus]|uniref:Uncharacterized protein n=1 Tax=Helianthus annuus TaxID=4232 RepID=A0A9K3JXR6_HELAN|nr:hypothetical protein HanXRQr2_Chr01g0033041 [Helianthus annuus]
MITENPWRRNIRITYRECKIKLVYPWRSVANQKIRNNRVVKSIYGSEYVESRQRQWI